MKNITITVSDRAHHGAKVWAARRDTSLSKIVQDFLEELPNLSTARSFPLSRFEEATARKNAAIRADPAAATRKQSSDEVPNP